MLSINLDDVANVLSSIKWYLVAIAVILAIGIIVKIVFRKKQQPLKRRVGGVSTVGMIVGVVVCVNMICTGPMSTMLDLVSGSGTITDETSAEAKDLAVNIAEEGIALLENDDNTLPLAADTKLNVFGWASTNPILGGAGSGALNDAYETVDILQSLADAGI